MSDFALAPQRNHGGTFARADQRLDVCGDALERIAAAGPSFSGHASGTETAASERWTAFAVTY
jgi:hypothetical protein